MKDLTKVFNNLRKIMEDAGLSVTDKQLGIATYILDKALPDNCFLRKQFDDGPGVPPTGPAPDGATGAKPFISSCQAQPGPTDNPRTGFAVSYSTADAVPHRTANKGKHIGPGCATCNTFKR